MGGRGGRDFRNSYKGHMDKTDKTKQRWNQGREVRIAWVRGKCRQVYLNNNKIKKNMKEIVLLCFYNKY